jgi:MFS transporter, OCT family, solute carrier family 22 (organic cation transporter), member 18
MHTQNPIPPQMATGLSYVLLGVSSDIPQLFISRLPTVLMQSMHCAQVYVCMYIHVCVYTHLHTHSLSRARARVQAFVADMSPDESRSAALGRLSLSYGVGMATGPVIGGFLSEAIGYLSIYLSIYLSLSIYLPQI